MNKKEIGILENLIETIESSLNSPLNFTIAVENYRSFLSALKIKSKIELATAKTERTNNLARNYK